jgi:MoxR-like ATPase
MVKLSMGYPNKESEIDILKGKSQEEPLMQVNSIVSAQEIIEMQNNVREIHVEDMLLEYITELVNLTRSNEEIQLGVSIRGSVALLNMAKATAFMNDRDYMIPEDVQEVFPFVAEHRLILTSKSKLKNRTTENLISEILEKAGLVKIK